MPVSDFVLMSVELVLSIEGLKLGGPELMVVLPVITLELVDV